PATPFPATNVITFPGLQAQINNLRTPPWTFSNPAPGSAANRHSALIASKCSAALALEEIKESCAFEQLGLTWQEFCVQHVGLSRKRADAIIRQLDEFGEAYFRLSQIARISPETYRQVAPIVEHDTVEIDGQKFELTLANAAKIRAAIGKMRDERNQAQRAAEIR